jgi:hypothetical protein
MKKEENFEILEIGELEDFSIVMKSFSKRRLETKTVSIFLDSNVYNDIINRPFIFILLPFFSPPKQRGLNLIYEIENAGIKFASYLSNDNLEKFSNKQPGEFEKNVLDFIMWKVQRKILTEKERTRIINFKITELIEYLGLKFHSSYYKKVEEALFNLQETTYKIKIKNQKKAGNIIREVYEKPLNLIRYKKVKESDVEKNSKKIFYEVELDDRLIQELEIKHYSIFDKELLKELRNKNKIAERIFQFISMKRFTKNDGEFKIETLASIIPLSLYSIIRKSDKFGNIKEYKVSKKKKVLEKLEKAFKDLVELGYLKKYEVMPFENSFKIKYIFNTQKDNSIHKSSYLIKNNKIDNTVEKEDIKEIKKSKYLEIYANLNKNKQREIKENALKELEKIKKRKKFLNLSEEMEFIEKSLIEYLK